MRVRESEGGREREGERVEEREGENEKLSSSKSRTASKLVNTCMYALASNKQFHHTTVIHKDHTL